MRFVFGLERVVVREEEEGGGRRESERENPKGKRSKTERIDMSNVKGFTEV